MTDHLAILDASAPSLSLEKAARSFYEERIPLAPPIPDRDLRWRWVVAIIAAILLHLAVVTTIDDGFQREKTPQQAPVPVEIVTLPPKPVEKPPEQQKPPAPQQPQPLRSSGGDLPDKAPGVPPPTPSAEDKPPPPALPPQVTAPEPPAPTAAPALPTEPSPQAVPVPPASSPRDTQQAVIAPPVPLKKPPVPRQQQVTTATPPQPQPQPPASSTNLNLQPGDGGGDKYLNFVRDEIGRRKYYPPTAELFHFAGVPIYRLTIDSQGELVGLVLLESSGYEILDKAGERAIRAAAPFGPPPPSLLGGRDTFSGTLYLPMP